MNLNEAESNRRAFWGQASSAGSAAQSRSYSSASAATREIGMTSALAYSKKLRSGAGCCPSPRAQRSCSAACQRSTSASLSVLTADSRCSISDSRRACASVGSDGLYRCRARSAVSGRPPHSALA